MGYQLPVIVVPSLKESRGNSAVLRSARHWLAIFCLVGCCFLNSWLVSSPYFSELLYAADLLFLASDLKVAKDMSLIGSLLPIPGLKQTLSGTGNLVTAMCNSVGEKIDRA
jgi:hypothetical protein